jgi:hypothetical protein
MHAPPQTPAPQASDSGAFSDAKTVHSPVHLPATSTLAPSTFQAEGRKHYFQVPADARGTVVFLPGAARTPMGFWPRTAAHPECLGFPEDVSHTRQILGKGYAVLVPTPQDDKQYTWSQARGDHVHVTAIITEFLKNHGLIGKPLYMAGASAGGGIVVRLPPYLATRGDVKWRVSGILAEVATNQAPQASRAYPQTAYVVMQRDKGSQVEAHQHVAALRHAGVRADVVVSPVRKVVPSYFSDRIPGVTPAQSHKLQAALVAAGLLTAAGEFKEDAKTSVRKWSAAAKRAYPAATFNVKTSPLMQALLLAYGQHEHVSDYTTAALTWFETPNASFPALAAKMAVTKPASM